MKCSTPFHSAMFWRNAWIRYENEMAYYNHTPPTKEQMKKRIERYLEKKRKAELRYTQEAKNYREYRARQSCYPH